MKISQLAQFDDHAPKLLFGVEVDAECFTPPHGLETIGLVWDGDGPKSISEAVIDTVIAFSLSGIDVILEVLPHHDIDPQYLLTAAGNAGFSVSLVPPDDEAALPDWVEKCAAFSVAFLTVPNFSRALYPVSGFVSYLIGEYFAGTTAAIPTDPYVVSRFFDPCPTEWSDQAKTAMRSAMADAMGSEDELKSLLSALVQGLVGQVEQIVLEATQDPE